MDEVLAIAEHTKAPDQLFYYTLSLLLASALIVIIWKYADKVQKTLSEVVKMTQVHEVEIKIIKEEREKDNNEIWSEIKELRERMNRPKRGQ